MFLRAAVRQCEELAVGILPLTTMISLPKFAPVLGDGDVALRGTRCDSRMQLDASRTLTGIALPYFAILRSFCMIGASNVARNTSADVVVLDSSLEPPSSSVTVTTISKVKQPGSSWVSVSAWLRWQAVADSCSSPPAARPGSNRNEPVSVSSVPASVHATDPVTTPEIGSTDTAAVPIAGSALSTSTKIASVSLPIAIADVDADVLIDEVIGPCAVEAAAVDAVEEVNGDRCRWHHSRRRQR